MAPRKPFLLRTDPEVLAALKRWAADELRSVNGQIDFILRRALQQAGRLPTPVTRRGAIRRPAVHGLSGGRTIEPDVKAGPPR